MAPSSSSSALRKRKNCILKKIEELAILCDVEAMAIILGPDGSDLMTWPENHSGLKSVITKYRNHSGRNQAKKNLEKKKKKWVLSDWDDSWLDGLGGDSVLDFSTSVRVKIEQAKKKVEFLKSVCREKIEDSNPNYWVNFLHNGETNPSFSWADLVLNGEETPNCGVSREETIGQLGMDLVNGTGTEQFTQTKPSFCVDDMRSFETVPNCVLINGGEHISSEAQVNNFDYGCGYVTGQQYLNSSGYGYGYGYRMYDHQHPAMGSFLTQYVYGEYNNLEAQVDGNYANSPMFFDLDQAAMKFSYDLGSIGSGMNGNVNSFDYQCDSVTGEQLNSSGHGSGMYDHQPPELGFVDGVGSSSSLWM